MRRAAAAIAGLLALPAAAHAAEAPVEPRQPRSTAPMDPVSGIEGSADAWSVSQGEAGCYVISPYRKNSSRLAIGRHPSLGLGLLAVNFGLALPGEDALEPVTIQTAAGMMSKSARLAGPKLLFVPLTPEEADDVLSALASPAGLWLEIRNTWLSHGGRDAESAAASYPKRCGGVVAQVRR